MCYTSLMELLIEASNYYPHLQSDTNSAALNLLDNTEPHSPTPLLYKGAGKRPW